MKVKTILVSQPEPSSDKSPYSRLKEKHKLTVNFRPFIHVEGVSREKRFDNKKLISIIFKISY